MYRTLLLLGFGALGIAGFLPALRADSAVNDEPVPQTAIHPDYPTELQKAGIEGRPVIEFTVETDGSVDSATIVTRAHPQLEALALEEIKRTKFQPGMVAGKPVVTRCRQAVTFRLIDPLPADPAVNQQPVPLTKIQPDYPEKLRNAGIEGCAIIEFTVEANGKVKSAVAVFSAHPKLDALAIAAINRTKFKPGLRDGKPADVRCRRKITFALQK